MQVPGIPLTTLLISNGGTVQTLLYLIPSIPVSFLDALPYPEEPNNSQRQNSEKTHHMLYPFKRSSRIFNIALNLSSVHHPSSLRWKLPRWDGKLSVRKIHTLSLCYNILAGWFDFWMCAHDFWAPSSRAKVSQVGRNLCKEVENRELRNTESCVIGAIKFYIVKAAAWP